MPRPGADPALTPTAASEQQAAPTAPVRRERTPLLLMCVVYVSFGAPMGMLGAAWPDARHLFHRSPGSLGVVAAGYGFGRLATALSALPILRRWHIRAAVGAFATVLAASGLVVALTRSFPVLVVAFTVVGLASGCLDTLGNRYQTVVRHVGSAGLMFGSFGVGAMVGPVVVALAGWTPGFVIAAGVAAAGAALSWSPSITWPAAFDVLEPPHGPHSRIHVSPWVIALSLSLFATYCGMEVITGNWAATYLEGQRGVSGTTAAWAMSGFWTGMTFGRLFLGRVTGPGRRLRPNQLLVLAGVVAAVAYLAIPVVPVPVAIGLIAVAGLSLAAMFPTLMTTTADRVGVAATGRVMGWQLVAANVFELGMSAVVGVWVNAAGPGVPIVVLAVMGVVGLPLLVRSSSIHADGGIGPGRG